jgi:hypothetical protein
MFGYKPQEHRHQELEDLQFHGRCIAIELHSLGVRYDTIVHNYESHEFVEGWEIPAQELPAALPLILGLEGIFTGEAPRIIGREVRPLSVKEVAEATARHEIRQRLAALEKKHDLWGKLRGGQEDDNSI